MLLTNQATPPRSAPKPAIPDQNRLATWPMIAEANFGGANHQRLAEVAQAHGSIGRTRGPALGSPEGNRIRAATRATT
jgi:hypothetical protein